MSLVGALPSLFDAPASVPYRAEVGAVSELLRREHYLGPTSRGFALVFPDGVMTLAKPSSRRLPTRWLELSRWCIVGGVPNAGSGQWASAHRWLRTHAPRVTTVVSYSDPSAGHTGALYRACNWLWAPTWHRLRPPPTANGSWDGETTEAVKDRWVFPIRMDAGRTAALELGDETLRRLYPWAEYREPTKREAGGGDYKRWMSEGPDPLRAARGRAILSPHIDRER